MQFFLTPRKFLMNLFNRRSSDNNRTITGGKIDGNSNTVNYDQSVNSSITFGEPPESTRKQLQVEAADAVWQSVIHIKELRTTAAGLIDLMHPFADPEKLRRDPEFATLKSQIKADDGATYAGGKKAAEKYRPYIPDGLWQLLHAYHLVTVRPCLILCFESEEKAIKWWEDPIIKEVFESQVLPDRLRNFTPPSEAPRHSTLEFIESQIQAQIRAITNSL